MHTVFVRLKPFGVLLSLLLAVGSQVLVPASAHALIRSGTAWPNGVVPVCWRSDADDHDYHAHSAAVARDAVENNWGRVANLTFVGWGTCSGPELNEPARTVVIHWSEDDGNQGPKADVGYRSDTRTFVRLRQIGWPNSRGGKTEAEFRSDVLHEFGHALGFGHDHQHPERNGQAPGICDGDPDTDAEVLTPFDVRSITAWTYCYFPPDSPGPATLSAWDIVGAQRLYGRKQPGAIVGSRNSCLDIPSSNTAIGVDLQVFNCQPTPNQSWDFRPDNTLQATVSGQTRCADASLTVLESRACEGDASQQFSFKSVELRGIGDMCVDIPSANYASGQTVQLFECLGTPNQDWTITAAGSIKSSVSSFCLEVPGGTAALNKLLRLASCTFAASQQFTLTDAGQIKFGTLCVDSENGVPTNGVRLQLYTCKSGDAYQMRNQLWHLTGAIRHNSQCLDIRGGIGQDRALVQMASCTNSASQRWDYYFD